MKLYDLPRDKGVKLYGLRPDDKVVIFGHLDGSYSYCWLEEDDNKVVHISASAPVEKYKDGYKVK